MEKDAFLRNVPESLAPVFAGRRGALDACWELETCEQHVEYILNREPFAVDVDRGLVAMLFQLIRREIEENLPAYVCRRCLTRPDPQCHCKGKRWMTQRERAVPGVIRRLCESKEP